MAKSNLDVIHEALDAGLTLSVWNERGQERRFTKGQITREVDSRGSIRTTHLNQSLRSHVWLTKAGVRQLAEQAKDKLARKDEMLAEQQRQFRAAMGRD